MPPTFGFVSNCCGVASVCQGERLVKDPIGLDGMEAVARLGSDGKGAGFPGGHIGHLQGIDAFMSYVNRYTPNSEILLSIGTNALSSSTMVIHHPSCNIFSSAISVGCSLLYK